MQGDDGLKLFLTLITYKCYTIEYELGNSPAQHAMRAGLRKILWEAAVKNSSGKKRRFDYITIILVVVLLIGVGVMAYPSVSDYWNSLHQSEAIASYIEEVEDLTSEQYEAVLEEAQEYNEYLAAKDNQWEWDDAEDEWYFSQLKVGTSSVIATIEIPSVDISLPIYLGTSDGVLQVGVGHVEGSSLPIGGKGTHAVLSGHRGLISAKLFTDLADVVVGDLFYINVLNETLTYEVDQILIVLPEDISALEIDPNEDYVTLVTCTPKGVNTHRLLVRGHRVDTPDGTTVIMVTGEATVMSKILVAPFIAVPVLVILFFAVMLYPGKKRKRPEMPGEPEKLEEQKEPDDS